MKSPSQLLFRTLCALIAVPSSLSAATIPGLFNTGVDANRVALAVGANDPHYVMTVAAQGTINTGAIVMQNNAAWLANSTASTWIGAVNSGAANVAVGNYYFRTTFDLTGLEPSTAQISFRVAVDNDMVDVVLNGNSTGLTFSGFGGFSPPMSITSGFVDGVNTLEFRTSNGGTAVNPGGFRSEFVSGTADVIPPPGTPPSITVQPVSQTNGIGESATFSVTATGSRPLTYQWRVGGNNLPNATNASLTLNGLAASNAGTYDVVISNSAGSITSSPAVLGVVFLSPSELSFEPIGPSSRRTGLTFSEVMFHPKDRTDGRNIEFIEIYNSNPFAEDIGGYRITGSVEFTFPANASIPGFGYAVIAPKPQDVQTTYGIGGVYGPLTNGTYVADQGQNILPNSSGTIQLRKKSSALVLELNYSDEPPWPAAADGAGPSMILARPSYGEGDVRGWAASAFIGGSPGAADPVPAGPLESVVINEILAHTDEPQRDFVELHNHSTLPVDLSGCYLTDERNTNHFRIPNGVTVPPGGFVSYNQDQLGFALSASGETVYFVNPGQTRILDVLRFGGQANGVAYGRFPDGTPTFQELATPTAGGTNALPLLRDIVINEILYNPISGNDNDEFVELYNRGATPVDLTGWRFEDGINFTFPANTILPAGGYLVVAADRARMLTNYPGLDGARVVGDFSGNLSNGGERLAIARPDYGFTTNGNVITTNIFYIVVDEVTYVDGGIWGKWSDGGGSSLELVDVHGDNRLAANWADSDESAKSSWTTVEHTGVLDLNHPTVTVFDHMQMFLLAAGEALVDDVEVIYSGINRLTNANFEAGSTAWYFHGTHRPSFVETSGGFDSARALHLIATDRGDVANRVRAQLSLAPPLGSSVTLRAKARWLRGHPELLLRLVGNPLEAVGALPVPRNLGTPGAPNSRARTNVGPSITEVTHRPILPKTGQNIRVTARVQDPDGISAVSLVYRIDPSATTTPVVMKDDGVNGDLLAGDGIYTGVIPGQNNGALVAFRVQADDGFVPAAAKLFPSDAPARECLVRVGETIPVGGFGTYRLWMTQATFDFWTAREKSSNEDLDTTFVYGNTRVVYNVGAHFGSSENYSTILTTPTGTLVGYNMTFPENEPFLGATGVRLDWPNRDTTMLREVTMYWFLDQYGLPNHYRRFIHLHINGVRRGTIYNDTQRPNSDSIAEWYPDDTEGELFKLNPWYEANAAGAINAAAFVAPQLTNRTTTGGVTKTAYYRFAWLPRAIQGSANNYSNLFALIAAAGAPAAGYPSAVESVVDIPNWMRTFAMNDLASYWDAFGNPNSKNSYLYRPEFSGWKIMSWDFDVGLGTGNGQAEEIPTAPLFGSTGNDPGLNRMYATPFIVRHYWDALDEAVNGFFQASAVQTFLADRYAAFQAAGLETVSPFVPSGIVPGGQPQRSIPDWITARRTFILSQFTTLSNVFTVAGGDVITTGTNLVVLTGVAPVRVRTITINGVAYTPIWTTVNNWQITVPVVAGPNVLEITALDRLGNVVSSVTRTVNYTGADERPEDNIVINEIMYNPLLPESSFVELFNRSANYSFDLSGWRLNGVDFTFPPGTVITNRGYLVVCKDRTPFGTAFGWGVPVVGLFDGQLDNGGETITLTKPGATPSLDVVVDRVTYDDDAPWPASADGTGPSLQLIDVNQDNNRVSNWAGSGDWRFYSFTGVVGPNPTNLLIFLQSAGDTYIDDVMIVAGSVAGVGNNFVQNGSFEEGLAPWIKSGNHSGSVVESGVARSGNNSLHIVSTGAGAANNLLNQAIAGLVSTDVYTLSFWYRQSANGTGLNFRITASYRTLSPIDYKPVFATPGGANSTVGVLPPYPALWLSEVQPINVSTLTDNAGDNDPWIEIYNGAATPLSLDGYYLAHSYSNLTQWAFPAGTTINPGQYLVVWADNEVVESIAGNLHTSFRLNPTNGAVALARTVDGLPQIVDYLNYNNVAANRSVGTYPPGQSSFRQEFFFPTPRGTNNPASAPVTLFINEWMAANSSFLRDPMDLDFDDWFEIYNPTALPVDLSGFSLTDDTSRPTKSVVPSGISVPPQGYLLVWADEEVGQTRTNGDLHVDFKLSQDSEQIALYDPSGRQIDFVIFGRQTNNVSQGRWPNGGPAPFIFMATPTPRAANQLPAAQPILVTPTVGPGSTVTLTWSAQAGGLYRVEYQDNLGTGTWTPLAGDVSASGTTAAKVDQNNGTQRFYRVRLVP